jgi:hypothetical protein
MVRKVQTFACPVFSDHLNWTKLVSGEQNGRLVRMSDAHRFAYASSIYLGDLTYASFMDYGGGCLQPTSIQPTSVEVAIDTMTFAVVAEVALVTVGMQPYTIDTLSAVTTTICVSDVTGVEGSPTRPHGLTCIFDQARQVLSVTTSETLQQIEAILLDANGRSMSPMKVTSASTDGFEVTLPRYMASGVYLLKLPNTPEGCRFVLLPD